MPEIWQQVVNGITLGSNLALVALGLTLVYGVYRVLNLAHGELYMLGAFLSFFAMRSGVPFILALLIAMVVGGTLGVVMERVVFRPLRGKREVDFLMASLGVLILLENAALKLWGPDPRSVHIPSEDVTLSIGGVNVSLYRILMVLLTLVAILALHRTVYHTRIGRQMRAVAQDLYAAQLVGVNVDRVAMVTFFIASGTAALAGGLIGTLLTLAPSMGFYPLLTSLVVVVLGGMGSMVGAILAGLLLGFTQTFAVFYTSSALGNGVIFAMLFFVLLYRPHGMFGRKSHG